MVCCKRRRMDTKRDERNRTSIADSTRWVEQGFKEATCIQSGVTIEFSNTNLVVSRAEYLCLKHHNFRIVDVETLSVGHRLLGCLQPAGPVRCPGDLIRIDISISWPLGLVQHEQQIKTGLLRQAASRRRFRASIAIKPPSNHHVD